MTPLWFCSTASLCVLCLVCLWKGVHRALPLYFWLQVAFAALALLMIWAYFSPSISPREYEELKWWKDRATQAAEIAICTHMLDTRTEWSMRSIGIANGLYALLKFAPYTVTDVPGEIDRTFYFLLQQWVNLAVILGSCIVILLCKFTPEVQHENPIHQTP